MGAKNASVSPEPVGESSTVLGASGITDVADTCILLR
jgi:hypothetical protein